MVKEMLRQGKSYREIMLTVHVAPNFITKCQGELTGEGSTTPKFIQAYKLFNMGKSRYDVCVELQIREGEAGMYEMEFHRIHRHDELSRTYSTKDPLFMTKLEVLVLALNRNGIGPKQYEEYFGEIKRIDNLRLEEGTLNGQIRNIQLERKKLEEQNSELAFQYSKLGADTIILHDMIDKLKNEISLLLAKRNLLKKENNFLSYNRDLESNKKEKPSLGHLQVHLEKAKENFNADIMPYVDEAIREYASQTGSTKIDDLLDNRKSFEYILSEMLNEPEAEFLDEVIKVINDNSVNCQILN